MANKTKNQQKQSLKKTQKQKKRQVKIKHQVLAQQAEAQPDVENIVDYALEFVVNGELKEARKVLDKLKIKYPRNAYVYYGFGALATADNNVDEALRCFGICIRISPDFVEAHYNMGVAYKNEMKLPEMIDSFKQVVKYGEPDSEIFDNARNMLVELENQIQASDGIDLDTYVKGHSIFEQGVKYMGSADWQMAIAKFNETTGITPNHVQSYGNLGICYSSIGLIKQAIDAFDKAIELDPTYEPALVNRRIVQSFKEGECINKKIEVINYYKDYALGDRSYADDFIGDQALLD
jgi:tetratricopeptide (TPR) repeat protein